MYKETFPERLKKARKKAEYTQKEVEQETNIPRSTLANYEVGRTQPDIETLGILIDLYNADANKVLGTSGGNDKQQNYKEMSQNKENMSMNEKMLMYFNAIPEQEKIKELARLELLAEQTE